MHNDYIEAKPGVIRFPPVHLTVAQTFYLLYEEGFFVGASSGLNVAAAVKVFKTIASINHQALVHL